MADDQETVSARWKKSGFSCDLWVDPPGQRWEGYIHDVDEVVYVIEGAMEFEMSGKKQTLQPGDETLIPAGVKHSARNLGATTAKWYYGYKNT